MVRVVMYEESAPFRKVAFNFFSGNQAQCSLTGNLKISAVFYPFHPVLVVDNPGNTFESQGNFLDFPFGLWPGNPVGVKSK